VDNRKHLETSGPFAGLWVRMAGALRKIGCKGRRKVRADIEAGALHSFISIHDYDRYADAAVRKWLGLKSWEECWGTEPRIVRRERGSRAISGKIFATDLPVARI
jgi:hypothetical protein